MIKKSLLFIYKSIPILTLFVAIAGVYMPIRYHNADINEKANHNKLGFINMLNDTKNDFDKIKKLSDLKEKRLFFSKSAICSYVGYNFMNECNRDAKKLEDRISSFKNSITERDFKLRSMGVFFSISTMENYNKIKFFY